MNKFTSYFNKLTDIQFVILYLAVVLIYDILLGIQGFDMVDEGWVLSAYQQLFEHPQSAEYQFLYYNTVLVGALWNAVFGQFGILGFRMLSSICTSAIAFVVYKLLKKNVNRWAIFLGIMLIEFSKHYVLVFHHNHLTALICCLAALCLYNAVCKRSLLLTFVSGIIIGINIFTRIPNVSMLSLSLVLIPFAFYTKDIHRTLKMLVFGIIGVVVGVAINAFIMNLLGHWDIFVGNIDSGFSAASAGDSTHSISNIFKVYTSNYYAVLKQVAFLFFCPVLALLSYKSFANRTLSKCIILIISCLYIIFAWKLSGGTYGLYALAYFIMIVYASQCYHNDKDIYLIVISSIILFFLPFGSDGGIGNMGPNCVWIGFPLAIGLLYKLIEQQRVNQESKRIVLTMFTIFVVAFSLSNLYQTKSECYFDGGSRLKKTATVNHPLANTFTNPKRCEVINEMLEHLTQYVKEKDYLLCWQCVPMTHYLTHTYPYLNTSWPWVYDSNNLEKQFRRAESNVKCLPVILCNKSSIACWDSYDKDWDSENADDQWNFNTRKAQLFHRFIEKYNYQTVWENELFKIMISNKNKDNK